MGEAWRASAAWDVVDRAESALGQPLAHLLLDADSDALARTREAQLAVLLTSLMAWEAVRDALDEAPVAFAGHSLGQITALIASGALSLEDGVRLAAERADCTQAAADARPGRMAALLGATVDQAEAASAGATAAGRTCWVANDNAPGQVVIGGTPVGVECGRRPGPPAWASSGSCPSRWAPPSTPRSWHRPRPTCSTTWQTPPSPPPPPPWSPTPTPPRTTAPTAGPSG